MNSIYDSDLAGKTLSQLIELCRRCSPEELDGREFAEHKRKALENFKSELLNRDPKEVIDHLIRLLVPYGPV